MGLKIEKMLEVPLTFFPIFSGIFSIEFLTFNVLFLGLGASCREDFALKGCGFVFQVKLSTTWTPLSSE